MQHNTLLLRDYEGYSYQGIDNITRLSEAHVKTNIFRAHTTLKRFIKSIDASLPSIKAKGATTLDMKIIV